MIRRKSKKIVPIESIPEVSSRNTPITSRLRKILRKRDKDNRLNSNSRSGIFLLPSKSDIERIQREMRSSSTKRDNLKINVVSPKDNFSLDMIHLNTPELPPIKPTKLLSGRSTKSNLRNNLISQRKTFERKLENLEISDRLDFSEIDSMNEAIRRTKRTGDDTIIDPMKLEEMKHQIERFGIKELGKK